MSPLSIPPCETPASTRTRRSIWWSATACRRPPRYHPRTWRRLQFLISVSGPLDPATRDEFEQRFGIPIRWPMAQRNSPVRYARGPRRWSRSSARPNATAWGDHGLTLRCIVDPDTGAVVPTGARWCSKPASRCSRRTGSAPPTSRRWTTTGSSRCTDAPTARASGAASRSCPRRCDRCWLDHPSVRDACMVGVPDDRLGQVPFAAVEPARGQPVPG